jgi:hypothetical protein
VKPRKKIITTLWQHGASAAQVMRCGLMPKRIHSEYASSSIKENDMTENQCSLRQVDFNRFVIVNEDGEPIEEYTDGQEAERAFMALLTPEQIADMEAAQQAYEDELEEERANRQLSCDHYAGF